MRERVGARRVEFLLLLSLAVPLLAPSGTGLGSLLASALSPILPAPGRAFAGSPEDEGYREAYLRLLEENARLRARLIAIGEPARLVASDPAFWDRNPLRIEAEVVDRDASPWRGSIQVAAGKRDGIRIGMPVTVGETFVGTVVRVGPRVSRVRLLTDPGHRVWAAIRSREALGEGYLEGTGDETLDMSLVRTGAGKTGDHVFTAGGTPLVPRGLYIGTVARMEDVDRDGIAEVEVRPALEAETVRVVNILAVEEPE